MNLLAYDHLDVYVNGLRIYNGPLCEFVMPKFTTPATVQMVSSRRYRGRHRKAA